MARATHCFRVANSGGDAGEGSCSRSSGRRQDQAVTVQIVSAASMPAMPPTMGVKRSPFRVPVSTPGPAGATPQPRPCSAYLPIIGASTDASPSRLDRSTGGVLLQSDLFPPKWPRPLSRYLHGGRR
jgi:hypothetical protein